MFLALLAAARPAIATEAVAAAGVTGSTSAAEPADSASAGSEIIAYDVRIVGDGRRTRFVADLTEGVSLSVFTLADPYRVVVDLPEMRFAFREGTGTSGRGLVSVFRYGRISAGKSRIVLDATGPVEVDKAFVLDAVEDQPARLVVDIVPTSRAAFLETVRRQREEQPPAARKTDREIAAPRPGDGRVRVVIDPGHGGIDSGASGNTGTLEKDVVLAFARTLETKLNGSGRYDVFLTRSDDTFLGLAARVDFARRHHADLFISIHADSFRGNGVRGATVYTLSEEASNEMAAEVAEGENRSDALAGLDIEETEDGVVDILLDLTRRETKNFSIVFARTLVKDLGAGVRMFKNPHQEAGFRVLKAPDVPSALVELGYMSNSEDEKLLNDPDWRSKAADGLVRAIDSYFSQRLARSGGR